MRGCGAIYTTHLCSILLLLALSKSFSASNKAVRTIHLGSVTVQTLAGGTSGYQDGVGSNARFNSLTGITTNPSATLAYVSDANNGCIRALNVGSATVTTLAGDQAFTSSCTNAADGVGTNAQMCQPVGIILDVTGDVLYFADATLATRTLRRIQVSTATVTTVAGSAAATSFVNGVGTAAGWGTASGASTQPYGLAWMKSGLIAITGGSRNAGVRTFDPATAAVAALVGCSGCSALSCATGWADGVGSSALFRSTTFVAASLSSGVLYVSDSESNLIRAVNGTTVTTLSGLRIATCAPGYADGVGSAASFVTPAGAAINEAGSLALIADAGASTVRAVDLASLAVTTLAGVGGAPGFAPGTGAAARMASPAAVTFNGAGTLAWVVDSSLSAVLTLTVPGGALALFDHPLLVVLFASITIER